jgi:hypothetical protein
MRSGAFVCGIGLEDVPEFWYYRDRTKRPGQISANRGLFNSPLDDGFYPMAIAKSLEQIVVRTP